MVGVSWLVASAAWVGVTSQPLSPHSSSVVVPASTPVVSSAASAGGNAGTTTVTDTVTLSSGTATATGTLTFRLWSDVACTVEFGSPSVVAVHGANGVAYTSAPLLPMAAGTYRWTAEYSGDADNTETENACGAAGSTVAITVGPAVALAFTTSTTGGTGGSVWATQPVVAVIDAGGNTVTSSTAAVTLAISTDPASGTLTCTTNPRTAVAGVATFAGCSIDRSGGGYVVTASSLGLTSVASTSFSITTGPATTLVITQQPGGGYGNASWAAQPVVAVRDAGGNLVTTSSASVTLAIGTNPASGTLSCTSNPVSASSGVATFAGCAISKVGTGYTLVASSSGLTSATSNAFDITVSPLGWSAIGFPAEATSNSTVTVGYPTGTATNDLLFLVEVNSSGGNTATPSGWTLLVDQSATKPAKFGFKVWTRLSGGETSVPLAFKATSAGSTAWVVRYTRQSGYPPNPASATATVRSGVATASSTLTPATDLTTNAASASVVSIVAVRGANTLSLGTARSFLFRSTQTNVPVGGQGVAIGVADLLAPTSGTTVPSPTWSQSGTAAQWVWATVAFS